MVKKREALGMCKKEFLSIFSYFSYKFFLKKNRFFQEFRFEPDIMNQISLHDQWKAHFNKKDAEDEQKKERKKERN